MQILIVNIENKGNGQLTKKGQDLEGDGVEVAVGKRI